MIVEASAGTGKTRRLVSEIAAAIASGVEIERIAAVTFTHAAAGSMKIRLRQELDRLRRDPTTSIAEQGRLRSALKSLDRAFIGTIHAFCAHLLRQRPVEACIDPDFQELTQPDALRVFGQVFRSWIEYKLAEPTPALRRSLARLAWKSDRSAAGPLDSLREAAWCLADWRDFDGAWERRDFDRASVMQKLLARTEEFVELRNTGEKTRDPLYRHFQPVADMLERIRQAKALGVMDSDALEAELLSLKYRLERYPRKGNAQYAATLLPEWERLEAEIQEFRQFADADLVSQLRDDLWEVVRKYQQTKLRAGQLDFTDLLVYTRNLLRNEHARRDLQARYQRLYVDEFQDTDPLQSEILLLLCEDQKHKLFVVGDPKQSIYRFRRADAREYRRIRQHLLDSGLPSDKLHASHRSVEPIQQFVNAAFEDQIPDYLPLSGGRPVSEPAVIALPMPRVYGMRNLSSKALGACSPDTTAAFIEWLLKAGWKEEQICVLFRKFVSYDTDLTQEYVRALEARHIRHVLVGSKSFHQREEIGTIRTALRAVEYPDEEISVFAVLRGTLFFIRDSTLLKFHGRFKRFSALQKLPEDLDPEFDRLRDALAIIRELHIQRNSRPPADTIRELLERTRAHAAFAFHHGGERRLANLYRLSDLARSFELSGPSSFRAFVEYLEHEYDSGEQSEAPVLEQQGGGVQLMTVHKAKGLEFPVVILADVPTRMTRRDGSGRYVDPEHRLCAQRLCGWSPWELVNPKNQAEEEAEDRAEAIRLAYVAATRARDLLVVSAVGECEWPESWLTPLYKALYPPKDRWQTARPHASCPTRGFETVLDRPPGQDGVSIRPGLHTPECGTHEVFWFDPALLDLSERETHGLDHDELLAKDPEQEKEGLRHYHAWRETREAVIQTASQPQHRVRRATEAAEAAEARHIPVQIVYAEGPAQRPAGRNFGKLVHAILQQGNAADAERLAAIHGRRWNATDADVAAAAATARAALAHPELAAPNAVELHRELPVTVRLASGEIVEGVVDLAWSDGSSWTVVDYKTGKTEKRYEAQLRLYALALERATGLPARAVLLAI